MNAGNAVTRRLDHLQSHWDEFREQPDARICRWVVKQDAYDLVDAFYQVNADESSDSPDIFLRFESIFTDAQSFGQALSAELSDMVEADREDLANEGIDIPWSSDHKINATNTAVGFLRNFFHFTSSLDFDDDTLMVAFIAPLTIQDRKQWQKWWADVVTLELPPQIRLMICEVFEDRQLDKIAEKNASKIATIKPQLDAPAVMRELMNEYGDQNDNCTHFRKAYFELTQSIGGQDREGIRKYAAKALDLARQIGLPHLEVTVLCTAGSGLVATGQLENGMKTYDEARKIAKAAEPLPIIKEMPELKMDLPGGNIFVQLGVQVLFFKGAGLVGAGLYERALEAYTQADEELKRILSEKKTEEPTDWSNGGIPLFQRLEALRMSGYCMEHCGKKQQSVAKYEEAVDISEKLDTDTRKSSTLAFTGRSLLSIYKDQGKKQTFNSMQETLDRLLGKGWEETLPKRAG